MGSSESTLAKMPQCWKSPVAAHIFLPINFNICFGCSKEPSH